MTKCFDKNSNPGSSQFVFDFIHKRHTNPEIPPVAGRNRNRFMETVYGMHAEQIAIKPLPCLSGLGGREEGLLHDGLVIGAENISPGQNPHQL